MMKINNIFIFILITLILSVSVFSYTTYLEYGNGKTLTSGCNNWLWSSCYPQNDLSLNFTAPITISAGNTYYPVLFYNMLDSNNPDYSKRYFYTVTNNVISVFNSDDGALYSQFTTTGQLKGSIKFVRVSNGYNIIALENRGVHNYLTSIKMNNDKSMIYDVELQTVDNTTEFFDSNFPSNKYFAAYSKSSNGFINLYLIDNFNFDAVASISLSLSNIITPIYSTPESSNQIMIYKDSTTAHEILVYAIPYNSNAYTVYLKYGVYDIDTASYLTTPADILVKANPAMTTAGLTSVNLAVVRHGTSTSADKIYIHTQSTFSYSGTHADSNNFLYTSSGTQLYNDLYNGYTQSPNSNAVFSDFNYDGIIEMCINQDMYRTMTSHNYFLNCYDSLFNLIYNISTASYYEYISLGKYENTSYMSLLTKDGIYRLNDTNITKIYNLSNINSYQIPLSTIQKTDYSNDIVAVSVNNIIIRELTQSLSVCGDGICSLYENPLSCAIDCFNTNGTINTDINKNPTLPCQNDSQCLSGKCIDYRCSYLIVNQVCSADAQCLSQKCTSGKCEQSSLWQWIDQSKNETFGYDAFTSLLVSMLIIIIVSAALLISIAIVTKSALAGGIAGGLAAICGFVFFTIVGWISPIFLFCTLVLIVAVVMLYIFMKSQGGK